MAAHKAAFDKAPQQFLDSNES